MTARLVFFASVFLFGCTMQESTLNPSYDPLADVTPPTLPAPTTDADNLRLGAAPKPRPDDARLPFPPPDAAQAKPERPPVPALEIVRVQPEGAVETVDRVVVQFNQPMVPVASVGALDDAPFPLELKPKVDGRMRWLDTQTLVFEAPQRLPFATVFKARVPAGVTSALGAKLDRPREWSFETPAPQITWASPWSGSTDLTLDARIKLAANVALDKDFVRAASLRTAGGQAVPFKVVIAPEGISEPRERTAELLPTSKLMPDTEYVFKLPAGWSSAEGSKPGVAFTTTFRTYGKLRVTRIDCSWGRWGREHTACPAFLPLVVELTNALASGQKPEVQITPAVEGFGSEPSGTTIKLAGTFRPETSYRITVKKGLRDVYGQVLAADHSAEVQIDGLSPRFGFGGGNELQVLETTAPVLHGWAVNVPSLRVRAAALDVKGWVRQADNRDRYALFEGVQLKIDRWVPGSVKNDSAAVTLPLDEVLPQGRGLALVEVTAPGVEDRFHTLVQATDLGLLAAFSGETVQVVATAMSTGEAIAGATQLVDRKGRVLAQAASNPEGRASLPVRADEAPFALVGRHDGSTSVLPLENQISGLVWKAQQTKAPVAYVFTDRGVYRPGEAVKLSVLLRERSRGAEGDLLPARAAKATLRLRDPRGNEALRTELTTDPLGFAHLEWTAPMDATLGRWYVELEATDDTDADTMSFMVEEFRTPELKVETSLSTERTPTPVGVTADAGVDASYYFGGPVSEQPVRWTLTRTPTMFTPPKNAGFHFGVEQHYWHGRYWRHAGPDPIASGNGTLDAKGRFSVPVELKPGASEATSIKPSPADEPPALPAEDEGTSDDSAWTYVFEASVQDANRQSIAGRSSVVAHRSLRRVGMRLARSVLQPKEETSVEVVVVALDGTRLSGVPVSVALVSDHTREAKARCELVSATEPVGCRLSPDSGGTWRVVATAADAEGRQDRASSFLWVAGGVSTTEDEAAVELIADKDRYAPGEIARLLVRSPFPRAKGLLVVGREGFATTLPIEVKDGSALVELPIRELWLPQIAVQATLVAPRTGEPKADGLDPDRPRWASGEITLAVASDSRRLITEVNLSKAVASPREEVTIRLATNGPDGKPVAAEATVMVVDEAVLALTGFATPDPLPGFYQPRSPDIGFAALQAMLREPGTVPDEELLAERAYEAMAPMVAKSAPRGGGGGGASPQVRTDFVTTPYFVAKLATDASGRAETSFTLPDNLTQFRVMAIAADAGRMFGSGEASVTSRLPVQVRPSLPRFLNLGDAFTASAVVDNRTDAEAEIVVRMLAANAEVLETHRTVRLAPGESREVGFPARAGAPGPAKFQVAAMIPGKEGARDAAEVIVPTLIPATAEAFATYGSTEGSVVQPVQRPGNALAGFGGLEVQLSSTALTGLRDAAGYLADYPHGCTEQLSSRLVPFVALKDVFAAFGLPTATDPDEAIRSTLAAIEKNRRPDGGFGYWADSRESSLHLTAWVAFVMQEAQQRGLLANGHTLDQTVLRLQELVRNPPQAWERRAEPRALAALVLARAGRADVALLEELSKQPLPIFVRAWLAEAWHLSRAPQAATQVEKQLRVVRNAASETAGALHIAEHASETMRLLLHSSELTDAIVLHALLTIDATDPMIDKLARGLSERRHRGHWGTTHADAWAVLSMSELFARREAQEPKFDARVWLADTYAGGRAFDGRELTVSQLGVPMDKVPEGSTELLLAKQGPGRLYWRVGMRYAPSDLRPQALDQGFVVTRTYEPVDPGSVERDDDGTWRVKAGSRVRVRLKVVVPDRRYQVALVDPMPAGFEAENAALATTARIEPDRDPERDWGWWWSPWVHTELRDDRAQAFAEGLGAGIYEHTWVARATTAGRFIVPPARAEEMYAPETFGRSAADRVVVE